ncbi:hypothetical protein Tco_0239169, partial [Tanacetum coccineum]
DRDDDEDEEEEESSGDEANDEADDEDEDKEEEHPAPTDSIPPPPPPAYRVTARISDAPPLGTPPSGTPPLLPIPVPTSSLPLMLPFTDRRAVRPEVYLPPRKRMCIALVPREIRRDLEREDGYRIIDSWDEIVEAM